MQRASEVNRFILHELIKWNLITNYADNGG